MAHVNSNISHHSVVSVLDTQVERLIADHKRLARLVGELRRECDELKEIRRGQQQRIVELEHKLSQNDLAVGLVASATDRRRAKAYVNRLMREVDSCIALLSTAPRAELMSEKSSEADAEEIGAEMMINVQK